MPSTVGLFEAKTHLSALARLATLDSALAEAAKREGVKLAA